MPNDKSTSRQGHEMPDVNMRNTVMGERQDQCSQGKYEMKARDIMKDKVGGRTS